MFKVTYKLFRYGKNSSAVHGYLRLNSLTSVPVIASVRNVEAEETERKVSVPPIKSDKFGRSIKGSRNTLIEAAFSMLKDAHPENDIKTPYTDIRIENAKTIDQLLSIPDGNGVSRRTALKVMSVLSEWATSGKVAMQEFESDPRFIRLCKVLTKGTYLGKNNRTLSANTSLHNDDFTTILGVAAEEDAAKLMSSISLPHMIKVMTLLSMKRHRSTTLLRTLAFNISGKAEHLNLKHCADVLYSSAILNFIDENLLAKVCGDIFLSLDHYDNTSNVSAVVGSILTSLGMLRFKNSGILDALANWMLKYQSDCRPQDIFALFITLAILNHKPANTDELYKVLVPQLNQSDAKKPGTWLDIVWSLIVLNQAKTEHITSVLSESFLAKLMRRGSTDGVLNKFHQHFVVTDDIKHTNGTKLKLLNIDSTCDSLITNYTGPRLSQNSNINTIAIRTKEKESMVKLLQDCLSSLINPITHMKTNVNTGMGFYIDAQIALDSKHNPLPLDDKNQIKVAILTHDYHDMCCGRVEPTGINALNVRLLEAQNYKVLIIPYTEFSCSDKYVNRVKYLESKLKTLPLT